MKEFDYTKWDNKPREMWVWNTDESKKEKKFVVYIDRHLDTVFDKKILTLDKCKSNCWYTHCAEIEQIRLMTNYELAHWLWEGTQVGEFRECGLEYYGKSGLVKSFYTYSKDSDLVDEYTRIRVNGGEWKEPLIEE